MLIDTRPPAEPVPLHPPHQRRPDRWKVELAQYEAQTRDLRNRYDSLASRTAFSLQGVDAAIQRNDPRRLVDQIVGDTHALLREMIQIEDRHGRRIAGIPVPPLVAAAIDKLRAEPLVAAASTRQEAGSGDRAERVAELARLESLLGRDILLIRDWSEMPRGRDAAFERDVAARLRTNSLQAVALLDAHVDLALADPVVGVYIQKVRQFSSVTAWTKADEKGPQS